MKKLLSILLILVMCLGMLPSAAFAAEKETLPDWYFLFAVFKKLDSDVTDGYYKTKHVTYSMPQEEDTSDPKPSDLVATKSGEIMQMVTRQGIPQAQVGDTCEKGQILIRGVVDIINDDGQLVRQELVPADGDVYIKTAYSYYKEFPLAYEKRVYTGKTRKNLVLQIHSLEFQAGLPGHPFDHFDQVGKFHTLKLTENFYLPLIYGRNTVYEYQIVKKKYSKEQAEALARDYILRFLDEIMEKGVEILENGVKIEVTKDRCISRGTIYGLEKNGDRVPLSGRQETSKAEKSEEQ